VQGVKDSLFPIKLHKYRKRLLFLFDGGVSPGLPYPPKSKAAGIGPWAADLGPGRPAGCHGRALARETALWKAGVSVLEQPALLDEFGDKCLELGEAHGMLEMPAVSGIDCEQHMTGAGAAECRRRPRRDR
jgi:hypothetical protein